MNDQHTYIRQESDYALGKWHQEEKEALDLLQIIGELRFDKNVDLVFFRHDLYDCRPSEVLNLHLEARNYTKHPIPVHISLSMAHSIACYAVGH